jgi:DNA polymerase III delta subunit
MIIFLYGPDSYRRQKKIKEIIEEYRRKNSNFSRADFDLENPGDFLKFKEFGSQMLIFDDKKLAILKNVYEADSKKINGLVKNYLDSLDFTIIISEEKKPKKDLEFLLKKPAITEEFNYFDDEKLKFFIQKEACQRNIKLSPTAVRFLAGIFAKDGWGLMNELEKIGLIFQDKIIEPEDLRKISDYCIQSADIFGFVNAVSQNWPLRQKISALERIFIDGEEPAKIFNILAASRRLPEKLLKNLADYDIAVKSGKIDYDEVLLDLALT